MIDKTKVTVQIDKILAKLQKIKLENDILNGLIDELDNDVFEDKIDLKREAMSSRNELSRLIDVALDARLKCKKS